MFIQGRDLHSTKELYDILIKAREVEMPQDVLCEAIHKWMPGVKTIIPLNYIFDLNEFG